MASALWHRAVMNACSAEIFWSKMHPYIALYLAWQETRLLCFTILSALTMCVCVCVCVCEDFVRLAIIAPAHILLLPQVLNPRLFRVETHDERLGGGVRMQAYRITSYVGWKYIEISELCLHRFFSLFSYCWTEHCSQWEQGKYSSHSDQNIIGTQSWRTSQWFAMERIATRTTSQHHMQRCAGTTSSSYFPATEWRGFDDNDSAKERCYNHCTKPWHDAGMA